MDQIQAPHLGKYVACAEKPAKCEFCNKSFSLCYIDEQWELVNFKLKTSKVHVCKEKSNGT